MFLDGGRSSQLKLTKPPTAFRNPKWLDHSCFDLAVNVEIMPEASVKAGSAGVKPIAWPDLSLRGWRCEYDGMGRRPRAVGILEKLVAVWCRKSGGGAAKRRGAGHKCSSESALTI
jgi:hypothetical protein